MIKLIGSILKSSTTAAVVKGGHAGLSKAMPSVAFGGSVAAGVVSMIISGYKIVDCVRYQTGPGQCDSVIETNLPGVVAGGGVLAGCWGAFNTYNPKLHKGDKVDEPTGKELVDSHLPQDRLMKDVVMKMRADGATQKEISESLNLSTYQVRKILRQSRNADRGR